MPMFDKAQSTNAPQGMFNDVQNQNIYNITFTADFISSKVKQAKGSKEQLHVLASSIETLLKNLEAACHSGQLSETETPIDFHKLNNILRNIWDFVQKESDAEFMKSLSKKCDRIAQIDEYYRQLDAFVASCRIPSLMDTEGCLSQNKEAQTKDQIALDNRLAELESDVTDLKKMLDSQRCGQDEMMVSLQRLIEERSEQIQERAFYQRSLCFLSTLNGREIQRKSWMITSFDIEWGPEIGSGGYGRVFQATWNRTRVAVKVLKTDDGITPSPECIEREVSIWSRLSHPRILRFLGANVLDKKAFIVSDLMDNGDAHAYLHRYPDYDRLSILHDISQGVVYLHSEGIVHGDLKAQNVLIDGSGRAVLCDFSLACVKADIRTRSTIPISAVAGSLYWMSPERLQGDSLKDPCDIYAFGMTSYQIYTGDIPLGHITHDIRDLVVKERVRPKRPEHHKAPQLTEAMWLLMERCWDGDPRKRPTAIKVCDIIGDILGGRKSPPLESPLAQRNMIEPGPRIDPVVPSQHDIIIAVMGPTGVGKTTFIEMATGGLGTLVEQRMHPYTGDIRAFRYLHPANSQPIVLVDTPGFNEPDKPTTEILNTLDEWLVATYGGSVKLTAIIYFLRITDCRLSRSLVKSIQAFKDYCQKAKPDVILATTMWGRIREDVGVLREKSLGDYWRGVLKLNRNSRIERFQRTYESAWKVVGSPTLRSPGNPTNNVSQKIAAFWGGRST